MNKDHEHSVMVCRTVGCLIYIYIYTDVPLEPLWLLLRSAHYRSGGVLGCSFSGFLDNQHNTKIQSLPAMELEELPTWMGQFTETLNVPTVQG